MHYAALFLVSTFAMEVLGGPSARTFHSSQLPEHSVPVHDHSIHGPHVLVQDDASASVLVCQVVKVPVGQSGAKPATPSHNVPTAAAVGSQPVVASSVISSSQDALSNLRSSVRTAVEKLVDPVFLALQNASLWLNRTSQLHQHGGQANHAHQHGAHNNHVHQHMHGGHVDNHAAHEHVPDHQVHPAPGHQIPQAIPNPAVPMTIVSVPVLVPAVHVGSFPLANLTAVVPAGAGVASRQFSNHGLDNATSSFAVTTESIAATAQPASTPADGDLVGRTGGLPTVPGTDAPVTLASDVPTSTAGFNISTLSLGSESLGALGRQFGPPVVHRPVCPYDCVPPEGGW